MSYSTKSAAHGKTLLCTAALTGLMITSPAMADATDRSWKQGASVASGTIIGALVGGPIGAIAGAATGIWFGQKVDTVDEVSAELAKSESETQLIEQQLAAAQTDLLRYQHMASEGLELEVLFHTNKSELTAAAQARLAQLAGYINQQSDVQINLEGFADPRGSDLHNLALSEARVAAVASLLVDAGISPDRINANSFGASYSSATDGDADAYAMERRVSIELVTTTSVDEGIELASNEVQ
ncbi:MAG: OmpA family protein [Gammaproteobacteria bacterium]|nr:OmpA family protein [Gammaproteobacteria bacterium]